MQTSKQIKDAVKEAYGKIAKQAVPKAQEGCSCCGPSGLREEYAQLEGHYGDADLNLGCGIPTQYAQIKEGDVVLDLGSGAGNDVFVARELVGKNRQSDRRGYDGRNDCAGASQSRQIRVSQCGFPVGRD